VVPQAGDDGEYQESKKNLRLRYCTTAITKTEPQILCSLSHER
jgi:hypothetical protein